MMLNWIPILALWAVIRYSSGVNITKIEVPSVAIEGDTINLRCDYDGQGEVYTLKWYKDDMEFFKHQPGNSPYANTTQDKCAYYNTYAVDGVQVECRVSTERDVVLKSVSKATTGNYKCEVISDRPRFTKNVRTGRLVVFSEALEAPVITGHEESYRAFDTVSLNCSSTNTEYNPDISWMVNGHPAQSANILKYGDRRSIGLTFRASDDLFRHGFIEVTCVTSMGTNHNRSARVQLTNKDYLRAQGYYYNSGFKRSSMSLGTALSCLLFSVAVSFPRV